MGTTSYETVKVGVVGATGYVGAELVRWVSVHPAMELVGASSTTNAGERLSAHYPSLLGTAADVTLCGLEELVAAAPQLVFLAVPHTTAMDLAAPLLGANITVVDLSADFRLHDADLYPAWYGVEHRAPELLAQAVYGLPELTRDQIAAATSPALVACAGCYPTATALAATPALEAFSLVGPAIVDAKSGVSGAGRGLSATTHYCAADESVSAYKVGAHQHTPEMEQTLSDAAGAPVSVLFTPHLVPLKRGLLSTVYLTLSARPNGPAPSADTVYAAYESRYADEPFVTVLPYGQFPATGACANSNRAQVGVKYDERTGVLCVACAIDNLGKGAAAQGIQVANALLGLPEDTGLAGGGGVV